MRPDHDEPTRIEDLLLDQPPVDEFVSTGALPAPSRVSALVDEAYEHFRGVGDGDVSDVYPALAAVAPGLFGLSVAASTGQTYSAGDVGVPFTLMSVAKPFTFALLCEAVGTVEARRTVGVNATGLAFNSASAVERSEDGRTNPMVNPGAIATVAALGGLGRSGRTGPGSPASPEALTDRWHMILAGLSRFAGRELSLDEETYRSAAETNHRNRALAHLLHVRGALVGDPDEGVELYTRGSCLSVTTTDLAAMGSVLANGGVAPRTGETIVSRDTCHAVLATMTTAGLYETSGDWLYEIGLPGKSGISGGLLTVSPGKGALGTFSPPLDSAGNSVRGQLAAAYLSRALGLDMFTSAPAGARQGETWS